MRINGKVVGAWFGGKITKQDNKICKYLGPTLMPQAGVALGLIVVAGNLISEYAAQIRVIILCSTFIYSIIGPVAAKFSLEKSGEIIVPDKIILQERGKKMFIKIKNATKSYDTGKISINALKNVNLTMNEGEIAVILGPSGSGKSTLLNIIGGIDHIDSGNVIVDGVDIMKLNDNKLTLYRRDSVGFIFQFYNLVPNLTVYENVEVAANISKNPINIDEVLNSVGMSEFKNRFPRELSGGQQQRVSIARAIVKKPKLLLCDEPTGALDYKAAKEILKLITEVNKKFATTVIIITHNTAISGIADRIIKLRSGEISENVVNENVLLAEGIEW
ncbi:Lipoprotein-releasing system ATP-binding protein LolD [Clostridium vincentii]|uniref:Lipoprotein-releasing system ATP-binding protein LolD n=2 Tax=Clostridium vincentii TaxID=52704 RepID=A0A2T0B7J4_9CLOT|nr:Lipoprotein-releasing system ATP-binding protein LolD [Clostridium vincentii]